MPKPRAEKGQPTSMIIPKPIHTLLKREAARRDLTVSQVLRRIILDWFEAVSRNKAASAPEGDQ